MRRIFLLSLCCILIYNSFAQTSRIKININPVWHFKLGDLKDEPFKNGYNDKSWDVVSLPHTMEVFKADLSGFKERGRNIGWYRRTINIEPLWITKKVFLEFQGVMQTSKLWVNGTFVGEYAVSGYDSYHFDLTKFVKPGENTIAIRVDNTVNANCPPDFLKTDFMQFGGIYRDVFLVVTEPVHITFPWEKTNAGIRLTLPNVSEQSAIVNAKATVRNESLDDVKCILITDIQDSKGVTVGSISSEQQIVAGGEYTFSQTLKPIVNPRLWSPAEPYLYKVVTTVKQGNRELDRIVTNLGVRWFKFDTNEGFFLNGKHLKLVGANRHQSWPFIGNAVPNGLHCRDAEQLKEIGCNWVRLSHYPHDPDFLDMLDELGIMALEEGPTWMNEGPPKWMTNLETSVRSMIRRDRNHPSIIIWNACINHADAHPMLTKACAEEDPTRPRGQFDVPCPMNFENGVVSGKGALSIEHTGHTFPTTRGDRNEPLQPRLGSWEAPQYTINREYDHARKHWEQTNAAYLQKDNAGVAVWCLFDYNTLHNSFEGIARDGVYDLFRIPKYSYWWHRSELTNAPLAYVIRIDDNNACVLSNCQQICLSENTGDGYRVIATQKPDSGFALNHPPFHFKISKNAKGLKAEGLINGELKTVYEWKKFYKPVALKIAVDRKEIVADGSDISRVTVTAIDENGTSVDTCTMSVSFELKGLGQIIGENPMKLRAGKIITLVQSAFVPDNLVITAKAIGLISAQDQIVTSKVLANVDMPSMLAVKQPTRDTTKVLAPKMILEDRPWLMFTPRSDVKIDEWIESDPIMIPKGLTDYSISITGGQYRIYTGKWTDVTGKVMPGDAVFVRVKSPNKIEANANTVLNIDGMKAKFEVRTTSEGKK